MPVYYALMTLMGGWSRPERGTVLVAVCFFGLAIVSEAVRRVLKPKELRDRVWELLALDRSGNAAASVGR
jgi:hypothetical protein